MKALLLVALLLLAGCSAPCDQGSLRSDRCYDARDWHMDRAAEQIGRNETARQWHRQMAGEYWQAILDGANCKGWVKTTPWGPLEPSKGGAA